jgi:hypothetical protein
MRSLHEANTPFPSILAFRKSLLILGPVSGEGIIKVIFFGPSEKLAAFDAEVQDRVRQLKSYGVEVLACKWCSDRMGITKQLEAQGITVVGVGPVISQLIRDGWAQLTF